MKSLNLQIRNVFVHCTAQYKRPWFLICLDNDALGISVAESEPVESQLRKGAGAVVTHFGSGSIARNRNSVFNIIFLRYITFYIPVANFIFYFICKSNIIGQNKEQVDPEPKVNNFSCATLLRIKVITRFFC